MIGRRNDFSKASSMAWELTGDFKCRLLFFFKLNILLFQWGMIQWFCRTRHHDIVVPAGGSASGNLLYIYAVWLLAAGRNSLGHILIKLPLTRPCPLLSAATGRFSIFRIQETCLPEHLVLAEAMICKVGIIDKENEAFLPTTPPPLMQHILSIARLCEMMCLTALLLKPVPSFVASFPSPCS